MEQVRAKAARVQVSLYPTDFYLLEKIQQENGLSGRSATIRFIARNWNKLTTINHDKRADVGDAEPNQ